MEFSVPWVNALDLSSNSLNEDHRALLDKLNALLVALTSRNMAMIMFAANCLRVEAQTHFAEEELMMREACYPDLAKHSERHQELLRGLDELRLKLNVTEYFSAILDVSPYLERWFVPHLTNDDKKLSDSLADRTTAKLCDAARITPP